MGDKSDNTLKRKPSLLRSATIWGAILGCVAGGATFWLLADAPSWERAQITGVVAGGAGFLVFVLTSRSQNKS